MKRNITLGVIIFSALALGSCSTTKLTSGQSDGDDVYNTVAKAGDAPVYVARPVYRDEYDDGAAAEDGYEDDYYTSDDDYYYYDDYASRINRFNYFSPFGYYDDLYYGYGPGMGMGFGYGGWGGNWGWNVGLGWGGGMGFGGWGYSPYWGSPWGYGYGYGLGGWGGGLGYSYWGAGWGGSPFWGPYSAYRGSGVARPVRGGGAGVSRNGLATGRPYPGSTTGYYPNRPNRLNGVGSSGRPSGRPSGVGRTPTGDTRVGRPTRDASRPTYQPPSINRSPSSFGGGSSGGGGRSSGGGGGGRPVRP